MDADPKLWIEIPGFGHNSKDSRSRGPSIWSKNRDFIPVTLQGMTGEYSEK